MSDATAQWRICAAAIKRRKNSGKSIANGETNQRAEGIGPAAKYKPSRRHALQAPRRSRFHVRNSPLRVSRRDSPALKDAKSAQAVGCPKAGMPGCGSHCCATACRSARSATRASRTTSVAAHSPTVFKNATGFPESAPHLDLDLSCRARPWSWPLSRIRSS